MKKLIGFVSIAISIMVVILVITKKLGPEFLGVSGVTGAGALAAARKVRSETARKKAQNAEQEAIEQEKQRRKDMTNEEKAAHTGDERDAKHDDNRARGEREIDDLFRR